MTTSPSLREDHVEVGDIKLELERRVLWKRGEQIRLLPKEFELLACLMKNPGAPVSHVSLLRTVWGPEYGAELDYLSFYIRMLRKKIEDDPASPQYILNEDWVGYRFRGSSEPVN
jgi:two-component system KDP operon response regulator KdpE